MNLFRSGEHVARWRPAHRGTEISSAQLCALAHAWWADRLSPDWRPHTRAQNQAILDELGLVGDFWSLG